MSDVPFVVQTRFRKVVQTAPYESEEAEVSAQFAVAEGADAPAAISSGMSMVKAQVFTALNRELLGSTAAPKRGPGRPPKDKEAPKATEPEAPKTEPAKDAPKAPETSTQADDDFGDPEPTKEAPKEIADEELTRACSAAAKVLSAVPVKNLFQSKYGAARVSQVKQNERAAFLADLKALVDAAEKK